MQFCDLLFCNSFSIKKYETRGIYVTSYVSTLEEELHPVGPYGQKTKSGHTNITTVIEYSAGVLTTGEDEPQYKVPVAMEKFPTNVNLAQIFFYVLIPLDFLKHIFFTGLF